MELVELQGAHAQKPVTEDHRQAQGFALAGLLALLPLALTLICALAACFFIFERKSLAQSLCVRQAVRLQQELSGILKPLLRLNKKAAVLRRQRAAADKALNAALHTGRPDLIAATRAAQLAVIMAQAALRAEQRRLLASAELARAKHPRELRGSLFGLAVSGFQTQRYFPAGLAVKPEPADSASPDFKPAEPFARLQEQGFRFQVDLTPPFLPPAWDIPGLRQTAECSATLNSEEDRWIVKIPKASASSSWRW